MNVSECPYLRARVLLNCGTNGLRFWESRGYTQASKDHSRCTGLRCVANDLNVATYVTRHVDDECSCTFLEPDPDIIADIYARGSFPLIAIRRDANNGSLNICLELKAYDAVEATPFIAISHALSGGLGNPLRPALPTCQLTQIDTWIQSVYKDRFPDAASTTTLHQKDTPQNGFEATDTATFWFWMDSLCIPSHTTITSQYDLKARRSFKRATSLSIATLVLDEDSLRLQEDIRLEEMYMRIVFSSWFSRMWTLQEAVATPMVLFQTAIGTIDLDELVCRLERMIRNGDRDGQHAPANLNPSIHDDPSLGFNLDFSPLHDLQELRKYMVDPAYEDLRGSIEHRKLLDRALSQRRTSHEEDRSVIWANLLDLIMPLSRQNSANLAA